ncbi:hypothetical protein TWF694_006548 [Orbilia ellipsospora]|uniref:Uncharacterized protein n=1 Tax=Orbilia ellipsospora TaxID=2528407 RepID=A0AAV9XKE4_9PEZI
MGLQVDGNELSVEDNHPPVPPPPSVSQPVGTRESNTRPLGAEGVQASVSESIWMRPI